MRLLLVLSFIIHLSSLGFAAGRLVVCDDVRDPLTLDPHKQFSEKNHTLLQQIYEGLVRFDEDGKVTPALAVSWERLDPLRMRFHLRGGVRFHNGEPFDAAAVRASILRYLDPKTAFPAIGFLSSLKDAVVVDTATVDIVTAYPDGLLLNRLAGFILIVPPRYLADRGEDALAQAPVGTGPFKFEQWERGSKIVLKTNPEHWAHDPQAIDTLEFRFLPAEKQVEALLSGQVDLVTDMPGTATTQVARSGNAQVLKKASYYTFTGSLRSDSGPLADVRVRKAMNLAMNRADLVRYDALGNGLPLATVTMRGQLGHDETLQPYPYDPDRAKALLKEAGYADGVRLKVFVKAQAERTFKIVKAQLERVGIHMEGEVVPDAAMLSRLASEKWDMTFGDCPDPMAHSFFIQAIVFDSHSPFSLMKRADFDEKLGRMVTTIDAEQQERSGRELDRFVYENALGLFTYQRIRTYGARSGLRFSPSVTGMPYFASARWIPATAGEQAKRK